MDIQTNRTRQVTDKQKFCFAYLLSLLDKPVMPKKSLQYSPRCKEVFWLFPTKLSYSLCAVLKSEKTSCSHTQGCELLFKP